MRAAAFVIAVLCAPPALAQARIEVAPVRVEISTQKSIGSLRVRNTSAEPVAFEVAAVSWTQRDGEDLLTPTTDLLVSPPAFVIPPGGEQIVRVGAPVTHSASEEAFRLLFLEQALLDASPSESALSMRLELSLPVFIAPPESPRSIGPLVEWHGAGADRTLRISNPADRHIVLAGAQIGDAKVALPRYLLAGASVERPAPEQNAPLTLAFVQADEIVKKDYRIAPDSHRGAGEP